MGDRRRRQNPEPQPRAGRARTTGRCGGGSSEGCLPAGSEEAATRRSADDDSECPSRRRPRPPAGQLNCQGRAGCARKFVPGGAARQAPAPPPRCPCRFALWVSFPLKVSLTGSAQRRRPSQYRPTAASESVPPDGGVSTLNPKL